MSTAAAMMSWVAEAAHFVDQNYRRYLRALCPKLEGERWWLDGFYLILISVAQFKILAPLADGHLYVNLLSLWAIALFIHRSSTAGCALGLMAALLVEAHTTVPAGLFISGHLTIGTLIILARHQISWRRTLAWLVVFSIGQGFLLTLEGLVTWVQAGWGSLSHVSFLGRVGRELALALWVGWTLARRHRYLGDQALALKSQAA